jgi:hypothetical protein
VTRGGAKLMEVALLVMWGVAAYSRNLEGKFITFTGLGWIGYRMYCANTSPTSVGQYYDDNLLPTAWCARLNRS